MGAGSSAEEEEIEEPSAADGVLIQSHQQYAVAGAIHAAQPQRSLERYEFARFWEQYAPGGSSGQPLSRPLARQVILRALAQFDPSPQASALSNAMLAEHLGASLQPVSFEEAYAAIRAVVPRLQGARPPRLSQVQQAVANAATVASARGLPALRRPSKGAPSTSVSWEKGDPSFVGRQQDVVAMHPLGASQVDAVPVAGSQLMGTASPRCFVGDSLSVEKERFKVRGWTVPVRPNRSQLESENACLQAAFSAANTVYERLVLQAEELRHRRRQNGAASRDANCVTNGHGYEGSDLISLHRALNEKRVLTVTLEAELERYADRLRFSGDVAEKQRQELARLREDYVAQHRKKQEAVRSRDEAWEQLCDGRQDHEDLTRKAKTEQLRAAMLREAFENEQSRVGVSLGRAEAFVNDLVAATEGTRKVEMEEQILARECVAALSEICAEEAHEESMSEATVAQLQQELQNAEAELGAVHRATTLATSLPEASGTGGVDAEEPQDSAEERVLACRAREELAKVEERQHAVATELFEVRRRCHALKELIKRRSADATRCHEETELLNARSEAIGADPSCILDQDGDDNNRIGLRGSAALLQPRLRHEEAVQESAEARLREELADCNLPACVEDFGHGISVPSSGSENPGLQLALGARQCKQSSASREIANARVKELSAELEHVRSELAMVTRTPSKPNTHRGSLQPAPNLEAAALQRRLGETLAKEKKSLCRVEQAILQARLLQDLNSVLVGHLQRGHAVGDRNILTPLLSTGYQASSVSRDHGVGGAAADNALEVEAEQHAAALRQCAANLRRTEASLRAMSPNLQVDGVESGGHLANDSDIGGSSLQHEDLVSFQLDFRARMAALKAVFPEDSSDVGLPMGDNGMPIRSGGLNDLDRLQASLRALRDEFANRSLEAQAGLAHAQAR